MPRENLHQTRKFYAPPANISCYTYDAIHRPLTVAYTTTSPTVATATKNFVYDSATVATKTMQNAKTRLAEAYTCTSPCTSTITDEGFSYTPRGEITDVYEMTLHSNPNYYHISQTYWPNGAPFQLGNNIATLPVITYSPDGEGRVNSVSASAGQNPVTGTSYNVFSSPNQLTVTFGSTDSDVFSYDPNTFRMNKYQFKIAAQTITGNLGWNANGSFGSLNITDPFSSANTQNCSYSADDLSRISQTNCGTVWGQTFSYDPFGNIQKNGTPGTGGSTFAPCYQTSPISNKIALIGGTGPGCTGGAAPQYDANGNYTNDTVRLYTWDADNNMVSINGTATALGYDALDRMVDQTAGSTNSEIVYSPSGTKLALMNGTTLVKAFVPLPGDAAAIYTGGTGPTFYRHSDNLGSTRLASTPGQTSYSETAYSPFGELYATSGSLDSSFTGQNQDTSAGLYDFLFREQDPYQSRWTSPDPDGLAAVDPTNPQSWNRYSYVLNDPEELVDPLGLFIKVPDGCVVLYPGGGKPGVFICDNFGSGGENLGLPAPVIFLNEGGGSGQPSRGCVDPTLVQATVIPIQAAAAKFWNKTLLAGLGGSGGVGFGKGMGFYGSVSVQIAVGPNGDAAYVISFAAPAAVTAAGTYAWLTPSTKGSGFLAGAQLGFSNASDPSQLKGKGFDASGSIATGLGIGADLSVGGGGIYQANVTIGAGLGGRGGAAAITNTAVIPICRAW